MWSSFLRLHLPRPSPTLHLSPREAGGLKLELRAPMAGGRAVQRREPQGAGAELKEAPASWTELAGQATLPSGP